MSAHLVVVHDPFHPARGREVRQVDAMLPVRRLLPETGGLPYVVRLNDQWLLRRDWDRRVADGDILVVCKLPRGGGGSNPLRVVLMLAVAIAAPMFAPEIGAMAGGWFATEAGVSAITAGITLAGSALVNALIPPPKPPTPNQMASIAAPSPTYDLQAQGNYARLGQPIPVQYGRLAVYPDFAAQPYAEYHGNEQYLYQLFCVGLGEYQIESIDIDDTPVSAWDEITYEVVPPGGQITLFPANVITSVEVGGQDLPTNTAVGPYTANDAGTQANAIGVDLVAPRGLYYANDSGGLTTMSVTFRVEARQIDDVGNPVSGWTLLGEETISAATTTPQRWSRRYDVSAGRYEVRVTRLDTEQTGSRYGHDLVWAGLRAYLPDTGGHGDVTLVAMRMRATDQLSAQASRRIRITCTRKLPVWDGSGWSAPQPTRSIAWAAADVARASYGASLSDSRIDLAGLLAQDATWTGRGDHFDGRFDNAVTLWEALTKILAAGRAKPFMQAGILHFARDESKSTPVALFSMRNIVKGSFSIEYLMPSPQMADAVEVAYFDSQVWRERHVLATLPGGTSASPAKIQLFGVTSRDQAHREGVYQAASNKYRRRVIRFQTELEGHIVAPGDLIAIAHDLPQWGQTAEAVAWDANSLTLTLSEPLVWEPGQTHYVGLRRLDGSLDGPIEVAQGADAYQVVLTTAPAETPYTGQGKERTHVVFGWGNTWRQEAKVISTRPVDLHHVEIEAINEDPSVHTAEQGVTAPPVTSSQLDTRYTAPEVAGLMARSQPGEPSKILLSWRPAPGAEYYLIEQSEDGANWTRTGESRAANYAVTAIYGARTLVRVAAFGLTRGPWVQIAYGDSADYMWVDDANLMWNPDDTTPMWKY